MSNNPADEYEKRKGEFDNRPRGFVGNDTLPPPGWQEWSAEQYGAWCDEIGEWSWFHLLNHAGLFGNDGVER